MRSCPYHYAFVDIPLGDLNHDGVVSGQGYVSAGLTGGYSYHKFPAYESFPTDASLGGFAAQDNEGHFYMECSGKGECDRNTGRCKCYEGYTGAACQRSKLRLDVISVSVEISNISLISLFFLQAPVPMIAMATVFAEL